MAQSTFEKAFILTLANEARYVNDPDDPGGETKYGISARSYPNLNIKNLTVSDAKTIYRMDFWEKPGFNRLAVVAPDLAVKGFDLGVNCGPRTAIKFLQRAVNTVCAGFVAPLRRSTWRQRVAAVLKGKPLLVDGLLGPVTILVIESCPCDTALMVALKGEAYAHYKNGKPLYVPGWLARLEN